MPQFGISIYSVSNKVMSGEWTAAQAVEWYMKDFYIRPENRDPGDAKLFDCANAWFRSVAKSYLRGSILAQGDLDIPLILGIIKHSGFDGNIFIEYEGMEECLYGTRISYDNLRRIWNEV